MELSHYEVLGVPRDADHATIRAAYRRRARETHPDAGGDEVEFAAVSVAWWTLSSPERRARYDAGDVREDDGWGEDLGWDEPVPAPRPPEPAPAASDAPAEPAPEDPAPEDSAAGDASGERPPGSTADPGIVDPDDGPVDAFTSEPRVLPPVAPSGALPDRLRDVWFDVTRRRTWTRRRLTVLGVVVGLLLVAAPFVVHGAVTGDLTSTIPMGLAAYALVFGASLMVRGGTRDDVRAAPYITAVFLWAPVLGFAGIGTYYLTTGVTVARLAVILLPLAASVALARDADRRLRLGRERAHVQRGREVQRRLASRWNRLLALRAEHGAAHVVPGEQHGRAVWELVAEGTREVLTWAPAGAPVAWARELRALGVPVAPVPRHPVRATAAAS